MLQVNKATRYSLTMKNRPGELMKLTKFLSDAGVNVSTLRIANFGSHASIEFSTTKECALPMKFRKTAGA